MQGMRSFLAAAMLPVIALALSACQRQQSVTPAQTKSLTPAQMKEAAIACQSKRDFACAEQNWQGYVAARPTDTQAIANLGMVMNERDEHEQAVVQFKKAIDLGEGSYDLFAYYADSLTKLGRTSDAIDWSYKTLILVPQLVDVRGNLAKLLVQQKRTYEALNLLAEFDRDLEAREKGQYFEAQRIAIEAGLHDAGTTATPETAHLRLPKIGDSFSAPVTLGKRPVSAFVVDTGASETTLDEQFLVASEAKFEVTRPHVVMRIADGRIVSGRLVSIDHLKIGAFALDHVTAVICTDCSMLLGQGTLSHFDMSSSKVQGVEFLTLSPRAN